MYFETYGALGELQFSADFVGYYLRRSLSGVCGAPLGNSGASSLSIDMSGYSAFSFVAISMLGYGAARHGYGGSTFRFQTTAPVGTAFSAFIFDRATELPASTFGAEAYNAIGERVFSATARPVVVLGLLGSGSFAVPGRSLATGSLTMAGHRIAENFEYYEGVWPTGNQVADGEPYDYINFQNNGKLYGGQVAADGQTASVVEVSYDDVYAQNSSGAPPDWQIPAQILVVDVTGVPANTVFF